MQRRRGVIAHRRSMGVGVHIQLGSSRHNGRLWGLTVGIAAAILLGLTAMGLVGAMGGSPILFMMGSMAIAGGPAGIIAGVSVALVVLLMAFVIGVAINRAQVRLAEELKQVQPADPDAADGLSSISDAAPALTPQRSLSSISLQSEPARPTMPRDTISRALSCSASF